MLASSFVTLPIHSQDELKNVYVPLVSHLLHGASEIDRDQVSKALAMAPGITGELKNISCPLLSSFPSHVFIFIAVSLV